MCRRIAESNLMPALSIGSLIRAVTPGYYLLLFMCRSVAGSDFVLDSWLAASIIHWPFALVRVIGLGAAYCCLRARVWQGLISYWTRDGHPTLFFPLFIFLFLFLFTYFFSTYFFFLYFLFSSSSSFLCFSLVYFWHVFRHYYLWVYVPVRHSPGSDLLLDSWLPSHLLWYG